MKQEWVTISIEARRAFVLGQLEAEVQCVLRWEKRKAEAENHICEAEYRIKQLNQTLEVLK